MIRHLALLLRLIHAQRSTWDTLSMAEGVCCWGVELLARCFRRHQYTDLVPKKWWG